MRLNSVRLRLTAWNVAVLGLILIGFAATLAYGTRAEMLRATDDELRTRVNMDREWYVHIHRVMLENADLAFPMPGGPPRRNRFGSNRPDTTLLSDGTLSPKATDAERYSYFRRARLFDPRGKRLLPWGGDGVQPAPFDQKGFAEALAGKEVHTDVTINGQPVRVFSAPVLFEGITLGVAQAARPVADQERIAATQLRTVLTLLPVALLISALAGIFLASRALRPVRQMTQEAASIGAEDLSRRLPVTGGDEMAELAATFNGMIGRMEESFKSTAAAYERLEGLYDQQRRFTGDASHELRTPLTRIKAHSSLALSRDRTGPEYRQTLQTVDQAADVMQRIVEDLLLLARSDAGQLELKRQPVPVGELLARAASVARPGVPVRVEPVDPMLGVIGDPHHLGRLLGNLLDNAVRHTPDSGRITLAASRVGDRAVITVTDTGEGIAEEHLPHLCERFYRVDPARARRQGGTGLGLSICQSIVQAHGGSLEITSRVGEGTTATVALAIARMAESTDPDFQAPDSDRFAERVPLREAPRVASGSAS